MDEAKKYAVLLKALKACEKNYHSHVREFGKLDRTDISFWADQLSDFSPERLERSGLKKEGTTGAPTSVCL